MTRPRGVCSGEAKTTGGACGSFGAALYDNLYKGYSPEGKNTLCIMTLQGFDHWEKYAADYFTGEKKACRADILIDQAENVLLPGLRKAIESGRRRPR